MTKNIYYQGIDWEIEYDWEDDARTDMYITAIKVKGSDADIYDHLLESTLDGLYEELEESFQ
jgi:hypothetical protein